MGESKLNYIKVLSKYLKGQKLKLSILALAIFIRSGIQLLTPLLVSHFIDTAMNGTKGSSYLVQLSLVYIVLVLMVMGISLGIVYVSQKVGWMATNRLREDLVVHCLNLDMSYHNTKRPGELIEVIDGDINVLFNFFSRMGIILTSNVFLLIGVLAMYYKIDYRMGILQTLFVMCIWWALMKIKTIGVGYKKEERKNFTDLCGFVGETIQNTEDIAGVGAKGYVMTHFKRSMRKWRVIRKKSGLIDWVPFMVLLLLQAIGFGMVFGIGTYLWQQGAITLGMIYLFYDYTRYILQPVSAIQQEFTDLQNVGASLERIGELMACQSLIENKASDLKIMAQDHLKIDNISFAYDQRDVLKEVSLHIKPGESVGLIGRTGSGKTTLASLLMRFYDVQSGSIQIGKTNIQDLAITELRDHIVYITQDIQLLGTSIRNNITFYNKAISDRQIMDTVEKMGLSTWFAKFPQGLDTHIGNGGTGLSAGEAQIIASLRAFLKNPSIVILDEVSSKLDLETEKQLQTTYKNLIKGRMAIIIAHRLQTIEEVNQIVIFENGKIIEQGKYSHLASDSESKFYNMLNLSEGMVEEQWIS